MHHQVYTIRPIPAYKDNYIWIIVNNSTRTALVVDPGEAEPVLDDFKKHHLNLRGILITHHHWDHTNGLKTLLKAFQVPVIASVKSHLEGVTHQVVSDKPFEIDADFPCVSGLAIPGHTLDHMAYVLDDALFSGDTLFAAGCGRIFEGSAEQMFQSLQKLAGLPDTTQIYCGHEYTLANLHFAVIVEPNNQAIKRRIERINASSSVVTLPSILREEKETNPFLRCHIAEIIQNVSSHMSCQLSNPIDVFAALREWKNGY